MPHADAIEHSKRAAANLRSADEQNLLTDAMVSAATTNQGLQDAISAVQCHADMEPAKARINKAIQYGKESGELSDANVLAATTIAGLIALTQGSDDTRIEQMP